jgi:hypothetical protein
VAYFQYGNTAGMNRIFRQIAGSYAEGRCTAPGQRGTYTLQSQPAGRYACYETTDNRTRALAWTHDDLAILSVAESSGMAVGELYEWWLRAAAGPS